MHLKFLEHSIEIIPQSRIKGPLIHTCTRFGGKRFLAKSSKVSTAVTFLDSPTRTDSSSEVLTAPGCITVTNIIPEIKNTDCN